MRTMTRAVSPAAVAMPEAPATTLPSPPAVSSPEGAKVALSMSSIPCPAFASAARTTGPAMSGFTSRRPA